MLEFIISQLINFVRPMKAYLKEQWSFWYKTLCKIYIFKGNILKASAGKGRKTKA
jgi:hypothetical protein